ncbi:MAG: alpha/beta fold hydrolase [Synergistaceae bacterium]|jgi:pimeloyl-ACP methyl ester carboxylesterase|nr:alpha/beta fold hydrolase [Synergistaceae bacterium]
MNSVVVLVHGFFRRGGDMRYLAEALKRQGFCTFSPTLPTVFQNVRTCSEELERQLEGRFDEKRVIHFVGHSMGGLIIRDYLSRRLVEGLGRVVLIGTPNRGTRHSNRLLWLSFLGRVLRALPDLAEPGPDIPPPLNHPTPEIGIVIGTHPDPVRKRLLPEENDGLVPSRSVRGVTARDELTVSCCHERLHWRADVATAIAAFLETGKFRLVRP